MTTTLSHPLDERISERITPPFWVKRVRIEGYKSIAYCDVTLEPFTVLLGRNGAGKSNFLSALALLGDALTADVREMFGNGRRLDEILCRRDRTDRFSLGVDLEVWDIHTKKTYDVSYEIGVPASQKTWSDRFEERLHLVEQGSGRELGFTVRNSEITWSGDTTGLRYRPTQIPHPYKFLLGYLGESPLLPVHEGLRWMGFYNFHPDSIREHQPREGSNFLDRHGKNLPGVIASLEELDTERLERIQAYLRVIVPEVEGFKRVRYGDFETVRFDVRCAEGEPISFDASSMSDGTLRAMAALLAVFQMALPVGDATVVGIEEPEASLHPAAIRALLDALLEATPHTQVILTTHSSELLAEPLIKLEQIRVVRLCDGRTQIAPVDAASLEIVRHEWNTLAGLHQEGRLEPNPEDLERQGKRPGT
jgi:predicted ATPase